LLDQANVGWYLQQLHLPGQQGLLKLIQALQCGQTEQSSDEQRTIALSTLLFGSPAYI
jgi:hypothetical protein